MRLDIRDANHLASSLQWNTPKIEGVLWAGVTQAFHAVRPAQKGQLWLEIQIGPFLLHNRDA